MGYTTGGHLDHINVSAECCASIDRSPFPPTHPPSQLRRCGAIAIKMGITDFFSDLLSSVSFVQDEAPADDDESKEGGDDEANDEDGGDDKEEGGDEEGGDEEEGGDDDEEEEEEEEEEEPVD